MTASVAIQTLPVAENSDELVRIVDEVIDYIKSTGLHYYVGPFETTIEGNDYDQLMDIVKELSCTVVSAVHDLNIAAMYCDYLYAMKDGRVVAQGTPKELLTPKLIRTLYDVDSKISIDEDGMMHIFYYPSSLAKKEVLS